MTTALSLLTSVLTLTGIWLVSKKRWEGWAVGLANQTLWLALIVVTQAWGLLLLAGALVVIYSKALVTWRREASIRVLGQMPVMFGDDYLDVGDPTPEVLQRRLQNQRDVIERLHGQIAALEDELDGLRLDG